MTNWTFPIPNITGYTSFLTYSNEITNNMFGPILLLIIFMVSFIATSRNGTSPAFSFACFITTLSSIFLAIMSIVSPEVIVLLVLLTAISAFFLYKFGD